MNKEAVDYYRSLSHRVEEFCHPLEEYLGITLFIYFKFFHDSTYITFSNDIDLTEEYCFNIDKDEFYFQDYLDNESIKSRFITWPQEPNNQGTQVVFNRNYWHGINILRINSDNVEGCSFSSNINNPRINDFFIRNSSILEKFAEYFKFVFSDAIMLGDKHKAIYKSGFNFYLPQYEVKKAPDIRGFLETIGMGGSDIKINGKTIHITLREKECLELMDKGYTAKEIGQELLINHRTVETHTNNIKHKTGLYFKQDLIKFYRNFLSDDIHKIIYGENHE